MIMITGATGTVGSQVVKALLSARAGHIRALTRNPGAVFPAGTQKVVADLGDSDLAFLRPTAFMSNALNWAGMIAAGQDVYAPFAAGRAAVVVDSADIAAIAAGCLTQDGHNQRVYELTGPEPLSPTDQVAILSQVLGRDLRHTEADPASTLAQITPTGDITANTGRPARSFTDWAQAHRNEFPTPAAVQDTATTQEPR